MVAARLSTNRGWAALLLAVLAALLGASVLGAAPASAHANLVQSNPVDGAMLDSAPQKLELRLSESVERDHTSVVITDGGGRRVIADEVQLLRPATSGTEAPTTLLVTLPPLAADTYRVAWSTISSSDLHATSGVIVFGVQRPVTAAAAQPVDPPASMAETAARGLGFLALASLLGACCVLFLLRRVEAAPEVLRVAHLRLFTLAVVGGLVALGSHAALLVVQVGASAGGGLAPAWRQITTGPYAWRWWGQQAAIIVLLTGVVLLRRRLRVGLPALWRLAVGVVAVVTLTGLAASAALLGHAGSAGPAWLVVEGAHQLAALVWAGGVLAVAVALAVRHREDRRLLAHAVLRRFGVLAAGCVAVLAVTGMLLAGDRIASIDGLLLSTYGRTLLVKVLIVAATLGIAAISTLMVHRRLARTVVGRPLPAGGLRALVVTEAVLLTGVLIGAATLGSAAPATGSQWQAASTTDGVPIAADSVADLNESISVKPNRPGGPNFVDVKVYNTRRPVPAAVGQVSITLRGPNGQVVSKPAQLAGQDSYVLASDDIAVPGRWDITVSVLRLGMPPAVKTYAWQVTTGNTQTHAVISRRPIAPVTEVLAVGAAVLAVVAAAFGVARRYWNRSRNGSVSASTSPKPEDDQVKPLRALV